MDWKSRVSCGDLSVAQAGETVTLYGWVDAIRDHGHLLFIHLRDRSGIVQVVFSAEFDPTAYNSANELKEEYVIQVAGQVRRRGPGTDNPNLGTGEIEVVANELEVLCEARPLPFMISEKAMVFGEEVATSPEHVEEDLRLRYRYLDLRRPSIQSNFINRYQILKCIRKYLDEERFVEVETPFLTRSTPEGARDYLVPSRVHQGRFFALPQSPQLFKQLLMIGGLDRYFQIARCFRDEDLRPNRQPEFTQLDLEASFIDEEFIYELLEELCVRMFDIGGIALPRPFERMSYDEAMQRYGSDRPDARFAMTFENVTQVLSQTSYGVFKRLLAQGGCIKGFCVKGQAAALSKNVLQEEYAKRVVPSLGGHGMTWMKVVGKALQSNIVQFFSDEECAQLIERFGASDGDVLMLIADTSPEVVNTVLGKLRLHVAHRLGLIPQESFCPLWVTDFPLFELKDSKLSSQHHPFTMPDRTDFDPADIEDCLQLGSRAYDLVVNGEELGGGSVRIHRLDVQQRVFRALGLADEVVQSKFGFFLKALEFGAPPHGGLALGLDRVVAMILKEPSIREVIAFPKNRRAFCPLSEAPARVSQEQLDELSLSTRSAGARGVGALHPEREEATPSDEITIEQVQHVAKLARLQLGSEEAARYRAELGAILEYVAKLNQLDTDGVEPMSHVVSMENVWREDVVRDESRSAPLLDNAPAREQACFKVPRVVEG